MAGPDQRVREALRLLRQMTRNGHSNLGVTGGPMTSRAVDTEALLSPAEVATFFRVDPKTVTRWAKAGKLTSLRTLGGHRRYREAEVRTLLGRTESCAS